MTRAALEAGQITVDHARIITTTVGDLPGYLDQAQRVAVERDLVRMARRCPPAKLRTLARRALAAVQPDPAAVDTHEDDAVQAEEDHAETKTVFWLRDNSDGTSTGHFTVPTFAGTALKKIIDAMTAPRRRTNPPTTRPGSAGSPGSRGQSG